MRTPTKALPTVLFPQGLFSPDEAAAISPPARYTGGCPSAVERQHEPVFWQLKRVRVCAGTY